MIGLQYYSTGNRFVEHLMLLFVTFLSYVVFPSFFVISDSNFRRAVEENAIIKFVQRTYMYGMISSKCIQLWKYTKNIFSFFLRDGGKISAVTPWQWIRELIFSMAEAIQTDQRFLEHLMLIRMFHIYLDSMKYKLLNL